MCTSKEEQDGFQLCNSTEQSQPILRQTSSSPSLDPAPKNINTVDFSTVTIREYVRIVGDQDGCRGGLPLACGWDYHGNEQIYSVCDFEFERLGNRRQIDDLMLSKVERQGILFGLTGVSERDVHAQERTRLIRERDEFFTQVLPL